MQYNIIIEIQKEVKKIVRTRGSKNNNTVFEHNPRTAQKTKKQVRG